MPDDQPDNNKSQGGIQKMILPLPKGRTTDGRVTGDKSVYELHYPTQASSHPPEARLTISCTNGEIDWAKVHVTTEINCQPAPA